MAIEPISSMMTVQAQGSVVQKPQTPVRSERVESSDSSIPAAYRAQYVPSFLVL